MAGLRAAAEPTRLRLLALCAEGELAVSELTQILGQSQPRVSRHLKLLCDAGLLRRLREGAWIFYGLETEAESANLARTMVDLLPADDARLARDRERLAAVRKARAKKAAAYFRANAARWNEIRSLHVDDALVEAALLRIFAKDREVGNFLDVGTGTGRILEIFGPKVRRGIGVDLSREMLALARANLNQASFKHCQVRLGDMYALPLADASTDVAVFHQVLHFADEPSAAITEVARVLRPSGRLVVVDFAPHDLEYLRSQHAHRRLGFSDRELGLWFRMAGLEVEGTETLAGNPLTVKIWHGRKAGAAAAKPHKSASSGSAS
jgi:ArsR family transcriptional regulator